MSSVRPNGTFYNDLKFNIEPTCVYMYFLVKNVCLYVDLVKANVLGSRAHLFLRLVWTSVKSLMAQFYQ